MCEGKSEEVSERQREGKIKKKKKEIKGIGGEREKSEKMERR